MFLSPHLLGPLDPFRPSKPPPLKLQISSSPRRAPRPPTRTRWEHRKHRPPGEAAAARAGAEGSSSCFRGGRPGLRSPRGGPLPPATPPRAPRRARTRPCGGPSGPARSGGRSYGWWRGGRGRRPRRGCGGRGGPLPLPLPLLPLQPLLRPPATLPPRRSLLLLLLGTQLRRRTHRSGKKY